MTSNNGNQNDKLASFDHLKFLVNLTNFEDANMDIVFSDKEILEAAGDEDRFEEAKNLLADLSKASPTNSTPEKKTYYHQFPTKEMEAYYKVCPHPNEKQIKELAEELGLHHLQVMFWFKNKHKQVKIHHECMESLQVRVENKIIMKMKLKDHICLCSCNKCCKHAATMLPGDRELKMENKRLKKEYAELLLMVRKFNKFEV